MDGKTTTDIRNECILIRFYYFESMYIRHWTPGIKTKYVLYTIIILSNCYPYFVWQWSSKKKHTKCRIILEQEALFHCVPIYKMECGSWSLHNCLDSHIGKHGRCKDINNISSGMRPPVRGLELSKDTIITGYKYTM